MITNRFEAQPKLDENSQIQVENSSYHQEKNNQINENFDIKIPISRCSIGFRNWSEDQ